MVEKRQTKRADVLALLQEAIQAHQSGELNQAEQLYQEVLTRLPRQPDAFHNLGVLRMQQGQDADAIPYLLAAIEASPSSAQYRLSHAQALVRQAKLDAAYQALQACEQSGMQDERLRALKGQVAAALNQKHQQLIELFRTGQYHKVLAQAKDFLAANPESFVAWKVLGAALLQLGDCKQAVAAMQRALQINDSDAETWANLGIAQREAGQIAAARASLCQAVQKDPLRSEWHYNLGNLLLAEGLFAEAIQSYQTAISLDSSSAKAHSNLGVALEKSGQTEAAVAAYQAALRIDPGFTDALNNLGNLLQDEGRSDEAIALFQEALRLRPTYPEALNNLARALFERKELEAAQGYCEQALNLNPGLSAAHTNLGNILKARGQIEAAIEAYRQALTLSPQQAEIHNNLGCALKDAGEVAAAVASYRAAIALKPDYAVAHNNLGSALKELGQFDSAIEALEYAIGLLPDLAEAYSNLGSTYKDIGRFDLAMACFQKATALDEQFLDAQSNLLFSLNLTQKVSADEKLKQAVRYGEMAAQRRKSRYEHWLGVPDSSRMIRVGFVSGDFRNHAVGYFLEGVMHALRQHHHAAFHWIAYSNNPREDEVTARLKTSFDAFHAVVGLSDEKLARKIHDDEIDILIDLAGHTAFNRLPVFSYKPAPVQLSWLGYFATTGVAEMDYLLADPWSLPTEAEAEFSEQIVRLPETRLCFTAPEMDIPVSTLPALRKGFVTFGCFNNLAKVNDDVVALWARILREVPDAQLFLKAKQLRDPAVLGTTLKRFAAHGVGAERLLLQGPEGRDTYLRAYNEVDICLDPFPYPGGTTTVEALWMGVPVLTLAGTNLLSRQGVGLLSNIELFDWVASNPDDYVRLAVQMASDWTALGECRQTLRERLMASPLCDTERFAQQFTATLRALWERWCQKQQTTTKDTVR